MNDSTDLIIPDDEPWMSHAFVSKLATQVALPYRKPKDGAFRAERTNGTLSVVFTATKGATLPYGKYPRLVEMWMTTMIKTNNPCVDFDSRVINIGSTFRKFLKLIGVQVGGKSLRTIKPQLENLFTCAYSITNNTDTTSDGVGFTVADKFHIDWLSNEPQENSLFENWVQLSEGYFNKLKDAPVPVDLEIIAQLSSPMALDVYWWLIRRYSYLHHRTSMTWQQLYSQFGSESELKEFKRGFKKAIAEVVRVYPQARITCGREYVTLWPSETSVPSTAKTHMVEKSESHPVKRKVSEAQISETCTLVDSYMENPVSVQARVVVLLNEGRTPQEVADIINSGA